MVFYSTSTPHDEVTVSESPYYYNYQDTMPSLHRPVQTVPPGSLTSTVPQARRFASPSWMRAGPSPNVGTTSNTSGFPADTTNYSNMSMYPDNLNGYMNLNVPSNGYSPHRREAATATLRQHPTPSFSTNEKYAQANAAVMDNPARPQNNFTPANPIPYNNGPWPQNASSHTHPAATSELQSSSDYGDHFYKPASFHGSQSPNTAQEFWRADTPVARRNLPSSRSLPMQYPHDYAPYPPQFSSGTDGPSSSYHEPSSRREVSSYHEPLSYSGSFSHNSEAYHGSWPQWHGSAIGDPQPPGPSVPEYPVPSMTPLPPATAFSQPYINHRGDMGYHSYQPPSTQPRQDPPRHNSRSRQSSQSQRHGHHGSHTHKPRYSPSTEFSCAWIVGDNTTCNFQGPLTEFKAHFRRYHLTGSQDSPTECHWQGCTYHGRGNPNMAHMRRDSTWRHVWETHLGMKRGN
ncbi:hypothetical protein DEU56DRAFT_904431 [Suillus clintonianus]|uniref:uncharacterized protein n=1 Tax=Suillus clintonianus TaxID=1904413 RepID=UPI001B85D580|nr:uncharacterized protein DEU56DRAFT_904431 [Suillus clintonianus]KAG2122335.1 hypothetical protein DEU56DRAFT_904431 [Suillus clintonianus]